MSTPNEQDQAFVMLPDLALGLLPADEAERLMLIVQSSPKLQTELASLRGTTNALGSAATPALVPAERTRAMRERLLARATASKTMNGNGSANAMTATAESAPASVAAPALQLHSTPSRPTPIIREVQVPARLSLVQRASPFFAIAAGVLFVISLFRMREAEQQRNDAEAALRVATIAADRMTARLAAGDSLVAAMSGSNVRVVDMVSTQKLAPGARMFWDRLANRWTLITHDLPSVKSGRTYQLWLVTAKAEKISAGTFNTDARGRAVVQATYPLAESDLAAIAITEEPTGGSPQPTGTILVAGAATK
jgi:anti-sigma-K factor RskA